MWVDWVVMGLQICNFSLLIGIVIQNQKMKRTLDEINGLKSDFSYLSRLP